MEHQRNHRIWHWIGPAILLLLLLIYSSITPGWFYSPTFFSAAEGFLRVFSAAIDNQGNDPLFLGLLFLAVGYGAFRLSDLWFGPRSGRPVASVQFLAWLVLFLAGLLIPFQILLYISDCANLACITPFNLLVLGLLGLAAQELILPARGKGVRRQDRLAYEMPALAPAHSGADGPELPLRERLRGLRLEPVYVLAGAAVVLLLTVLVMLAAQQLYRGYDALWYHIPSALEYRDWRHARKFISGDWRWYPEVAEILDYYLLTARLHSLLAFNQLLAALLCLPVMYRASRRLGARPWAAWLAAFAFLALPITINQALFAGNDIWQALFQLLMLCFLLEAHFALDAALARKHLALSALALGLALGVKFSTVFTLPVLAPWALWLVWRNAARPDGRPARLRDRARALAWLCLLACSCCSFWYVRNFLQHANPLYPFGLKIAGHVLLKGEDRATEYFNAKLHEFVSRRREWLYYPFVEKLKWSDGWGATLAAFLYPMTLFPLWVAWRRRRRWRGLGVAHLACFLALALSWLTWFALTSREPRYIMFGYALTLVAGAPLLSIGPRTYRTLAGGVFLASLLVNAFNISLIVRERWCDASSHHELEIKVDPIADAINALPPGVMLAMPAGAYTTMYYGREFQHRVLPTYQIDAKKVQKYHPDYILTVWPEPLPWLHQELAKWNFERVAEATRENLIFTLFRSRTPREHPRDYAFRLDPDHPDKSDLCGRALTSRYVNVKGRRALEVQFQIPVALNSLEVVWWKHAKGNSWLEVKRDGKWVRRFKMSPPPDPAPGAQDPLVSYRNVSLMGAGPIEGVRISIPSDAAAVQRLTAYPAIAGERLAAIALCLVAAGVIGVRRIVLRDRAPRRPQWAVHD